MGQFRRALVVINICSPLTALGYIACLWITMRRYL